MALNSEQQLRFSVYGFLAFIIFIAGYFYFQILNQTNILSTEVSKDRLDHRPDYIEGDSSVLETKKFKDLRAVVVPVTASTSLPASQLTDSELAKLPRNANPFSPSF
jgi:hypothetical protein